MPAGLETLSPTLAAEMQLAATRRAPTPSAATALRFAPLTPRTWPDFVRLFGANGACGGCWCTYWRQSAGAYQDGKGDKNKRLLRRAVEAGAVPGILAYVGDEPAGWCAVEPRSVYVRLARSRNLQPVDDRPAWAAPCFFVARAHRRRGLTVRLLEAAIDHVRRAGGTVLEGYPIEPGDGAMPAAFAWTGLVPAFRAAGFTEAVRRSPRQPIMRIEVGAGKRPAAKRRAPAARPSRSRGGR